MRISFMAQRSVQDGLSLEARQNIAAVLISYLVMFIYVALSLGRKFPDPVLSRVMLGIVGICIVLASLGIGLGVCTLAGIPVTMIVVEAVPFLILAIGVDNMFILCQTFDRLAYDPDNRKNMTTEETIMATIDQAGPSISLAALSECVTFGIGVATNTPALQSFCLVAAVAVLANWALQMTCFTAALTLDAKRMSEGRYDLCPWKTRQPTHSDFSATGWSLESLIERYYAPWLFRTSTRVGVILASICILTIGIIGFGEIKLGLEQQLALPSDFYMYDYLGDQVKYGEAGPLAYIVLKEMNYTDYEVQKDISDMSLQLSVLHKYIPSPVYSWLDTFNQWRQMRFFLEEKRRQGLTDCPSQNNVMKPFAYEIDPRYVHNSSCTDNSHFYPLVQQFVDISIESQCCQSFGICGKQFKTDIKFRRSNFAGRVDGITTSRLRTQIVKLSNESLFINSFYYMHQYIRTWSQKLEPKGGSGAFAYSMYFVYYAQYLYIKGVAIQNVLLAMGAVFTISFLKTNLRTAVYVVCSVVLIVVQVVGVIFLWNSTVEDYPIRLNAVSVVNFLMAVGLSVEFCVHMITTYTDKRRAKSSPDRAQYALVKTGTSVITGITLTKLLGISVLAFAPSQIYRVYFFRMYATIILVGAAYALILLPVLMLFLDPHPRMDEMDVQLLASGSDDEN